MAAEHAFRIAAEWIGDRGSGTSGVRDYGRELLIRADGKEQIAGSAARQFRGDADRWNPEELLLAALAECHMLSYLYHAARNGVVVVGYTDDVTGAIAVEPDGSGRFTSATLRPRVTVAAGDPALALRLHENAARDCFIANSLAFPVAHEPVVLAADDPLG